MVNMSVGVACAKEETDRENQTIADAKWIDLILALMIESFPGLLNLIARISASSDLSWKMRNCGKAKEEESTNYSFELGIATKHLVKYFVIRLGWYVECVDHQGMRVSCTYKTLSCHSG